VALLAIDRTCHRKCKYGEHFLRHVLLASSADNHPAIHRQSSHNTPRCSRNLLSSFAKATADKEASSAPTLGAGWCRVNPTASGFHGVDPARGIDLFESSTGSPQAL